MINEFPKKSLIVKKRGGGERVIPAGKWFYDIDTGKDNDVDVYEVKPYGGMRFVRRDTILNWKEIEG
jgi:hypothetical protein